VGHDVLRRDPFLAGLGIRNAAGYLRDRRSTSYKKRCSGRDGDKPAFDHLVRRPLIGMGGATVGAAVESLVSRRLPGCCHRVKTRARRLLEGVP
jgi:hypothetical protein